MKTFLKTIVLIIALSLCAARQGLAVPLPEDGHAAVVLTYHRVGEDINPESNIETGQFLAHVDEIVAAGYNVMKLPDLVTALRDKKDIPPHTIAITLEGAFKSALQNAIPVLLEKNIPFTVFYSSDYADADSPQFMNWADLKNLAAHENVTLGVLPSSYARLGNRPEDEIRRSVNKARQRYRDAFGSEALLFSYPFGEYSKTYKTVIENSGFAAAFGQSSGAASESSDMFALPRFSMTEKYGDLERFRTITRAQPFPAQDVEPPDIYHDDGAPIGFSVPGSLQADLTSLSCFASGQPDPEVQILGNRVEMRLKQPLAGEKIRINCTVPAGKDPDDDSQLWRWFGMLLVAPGDDAPENDDDAPSNPAQGALP